MDRQVDATKPDPSPASRHLMCGNAWFGVAGFIGCSYFAWISFSHILRGEYDWPHDAWTVATYVVWIVLLGGLTLDSRCLRERLFFGVLVVNFVAGCVLTIWRTVPEVDVRAARMGTGALWVLAAFLSLATLRKVETKR